MSVLYCVCTAEQFICSAVFFIAAVLGRLHRRELHFSVLVSNALLAAGLLFAFDGIYRCMFSDGMAADMLPHRVCILSFGLFLLSAFTVELKLTRDLLRSIGGQIFGAVLIGIAYWGGLSAYLILRFTLNAVIWDVLLLALCGILLMFPCCLGLLTGRDEFFRFLRPFHISAALSIAALMLHFTAGVLRSDGALMVTGLLMLPCLTALPVTAEKGMREFGHAE